MSNVSGRGASSSARTRTPSSRRRSRAARGSLEVRGNKYTELTAADLEWGDTYIGFRRPPLPSMGNIRWVHCTGAGVDSWLYPTRAAARDPAHAHGRIVRADDRRVGAGESARVLAGASRSRGSTARPCVVAARREDDSRHDGGRRGHGRRWNAHREVVLRVGLSRRRRIALRRRRSLRCSREFTRQRAGRCRRAGGLVDPRAAAHAARRAGSSAATCCRSVAARC